jgi:hypothetical protein
VTQPADPTLATNAALDAYNLANQHVNEAAQKAYELENTGAARTFDQEQQYKAAQAALQDARGQAATAARAYSTILEQQARASEAANSPDAIARAEVDHARAALLNAQADGYEAKTTAAQQAATTRAQAAIQRVQVAQSRVEAQNNASNAQANLANANAANVTARTPAEVNQANAAAEASRANAANVAARTPAEVSQATAAADEAKARARLVDLQTQQLISNDPLVKQKLQQDILKAQADISALGKPVIEPGQAGDTKKAVIAKDKDGNWTINWIPNEGQPMIPAQAMQVLAQQLGMNLGTAEGQIPLATAKELATMAWQGYTAQTQRQTELNSGANIGGNILNQRAQATNTLMNDTLTPALNSKNLGLGSTPNVSGLPQAALDFTTAMGGGQGVYDTAANMVHAANPRLAATPAGAGYSAVLQQMVDAAKPQQQQQTPAAQPAPAPAPQSVAAGPATINGPSLNFGNASINDPARASTTIAPDGTITVQHIPSDGTITVQHIPSVATDDQATIRGFR